MNLYNTIIAWKKRKAELKKSVFNVEINLAWFIAKKRQESSVSDHAFLSTENVFLSNRGLVKKCQKPTEKNYQNQEQGKNLTFGKVDESSTKTDIFLFFKKITQMQIQTVMLGSIDLLLRNILADFYYQMKWYTTRIISEMTIVLKICNYFRNIRYI